MRVCSNSLRVFMVIVVVIRAVNSCLRFFACFVACFALRYVFLQEFGCKRFFFSETLPFSPPLQMPRRTPNLDDDHIQFLQENVKAATSGLHCLKKDIRTATQAVKRQRKAGEPWVLTGFLLRVVLILYYLAGYQPFLAVPYLHRAGRRKKNWEDPPDEFLEDLVEKAFMETGNDIFIELYDQESTPDPDALREALSFQSQHAAMMWCMDMNQTKGLAPSSATVRDRLDAANMLLPAHLQNTIPQETWLSTPRVFVHRWRCFWNGRFGRLRIVPDIEFEELRNKVWD